MIGEYTVVLLLKFNMEGILSLLTFSVAFLVMFHVVLILFLDEEI